MDKAILGGALALVVTFLAVGSGRPPHAQDPSGAPVPPASSAHVPLYDPHPDHLWNRVDRHLRVRTSQSGATFGAGDLDPLLWRETRHLLEGPSHSRALELLGEFLRTNAERLVTDPVKRTLFQRDLWSIFDWAVSTTEHHRGERGALAAALAHVIRRVAPAAEDLTRVALVPDEKAPIDTYAMTVASARYARAYDAARRDRPFLPPRMLDADGPWVAIHGSSPLPQHSDEMSRSWFAVFLTVPGGRQATLEYLKKLWDTPEPFVPDPSVPGELRTVINPSLRPMPPGTQIALVRRMLLIDGSGEIRYTNVVESVQLRVFRHVIAPEPRRRMLGGHNDQDFFEFVLDRAGLVTASAPPLRAVSPDEAGFLTFSSHGIDTFERPGEPRGRRTLDMCIACHHDPGLASVLSARRLFRPYTFALSGGRPFDGNSAFWKSRRADWGTLQTYWQLQPR